MKRGIPNRGLGVVLVGVLGLAGCGDSGPRTHPVTGRVELPGGDVTQLAGSTIEAVNTSDPAVRAAGAIGPDGRFALETLQGGAIHAGASEGTYQVRIILADDDPKTKKQAARAIDPRFLQFKTSGLTLKVPTEGDVTLTVSPRAR